MSRRERAACRATIGLAALLAAVVAAATVTGTTSDVDTKQTTGTVHEVEPNVRRISVLTGCGHALRVMAFRAGTTCRIEVDGVVSPLADLRRGQIVAVRYRSGTEPFDALSITTTRTPDGGGKP